MGHDGERVCGACFERGAGGKIVKMIPLTPAQRTAVRVLIAQMRESTKDLADLDAEAEVQGTHWCIWTLERALEVDLAYSQLDTLSVTD